MPIHISRGDESSGPYSLEEVQAYLDQSLLLPTDLAWQEGMEDWVPLSELLGQSASLEPASSPPVMAELVSVEQIPAEPAAKPRSHKGLLIGIGAGVAVLAIAAVAWFGFLRPDGTKQGGRLVAQGGEPKDKGASGFLPAETNATVNPVSPQPGVTNGHESSVTNVPGKENPSEDIPEPPVLIYQKKVPFPGNFQSFEDRAKKGDAEAQYWCAVAYHNGEEVEQSYSTALALYYSSSELGYAPAFLGLSELYLTGKLKTTKGRQRDLTVGYSFLFAAAEMEDERAIKLKSEVADIIPKKHIIKFNRLVSVRFQGCASKCHERGDYNQALIFFQKALQIELQQPEPDRLSIADIHEEIGMLHYTTGPEETGILRSTEGSQDKALESLRKSLDIYREESGPNDVDVARINFTMGNVYKGKSEYEKALKCHQIALSFGIKILGAEHPDLSANYGSVADAFQGKQDMENALLYYQKALACTKRLGLKKKKKDKVNIAAIHNNIGSALANIGEYDRSIKHSLEALAIDLEVAEPDSPKHAPTYLNIGSTYIKIGNYEKAFEYINLSLVDANKHYPPTHPTTATIYHAFSSLYRAKGEYEKAVEYSRKSLDIRIESLGKRHSHVASSYNSLANVFSEMGVFDKSIQYYQEALKITSNGDKAPHDTAVLYDNIGVIYRKKGEFDKALEYQKKAMDLLRDKFGVEFGLASIHLSISRTYYLKGEYDKALVSCQKSLNILQKRKVKLDDYKIANVYGQIGLINLRRGEYKKAMQGLKKLLDNELIQLGADHPYVAGSYNYIGLVHIGLKAPAASLISARKARAIEDKRLAYMLSFTSERERLAYQQTRSPYDLLGTLGSAPDLTETVLRNKGIVLASLMEDQRIAKASKDPAIKALAVQLKSAQYFLNKLQLEIPEPKAKEAHEARRKATMAKVEELQQKLARNVKGLGKARRALAIKPKDVQKNLAKDEILLEFIRYEHFLGKDQSQQRYGVVVLAKEGEAKWVPLGAAEEIDGLCLNYGSYLKDDRITDEQYVPLLRSLHDRLMAPIAKVAPKDAKTWIISPASQINFVNFATFLTPKERFVCEDYTIKYVASGRDLVPPKGKKPKTNPQLVVFANPKYENKPPTLAVVTRDLGETTLRSAERNDLRASILGLSPLPGTQKEADYLEDKAPGWKLEPRIFVEDEAVERQLYLVDSPKVLHLATHGIFLEKPPEPKKAPTGALGRINQRKDIIGRLKNPMQRSALMFTGATWTSKQWAKGETPDTANDGILTAAEVGTLNLNGTKLVVMSACQTGLGDLRSGEGVMGLRRAFIQAGAQNLLMTLWPVSDKYTVQFMKEFYERAMADGDAPESLAKVQTERLVKLRDVLGTRLAVQFAGPFIMSFQGAE